MKRFVFLVFLGFFFVSCNNQSSQEPSLLQKEVDRFLDQYNQTYQKLLIASAEASWKLNTYIQEGDTVTSKLAEDKEKAMAEFTGSRENILTAQKYLTQKDLLTVLQVKQLQTILYAAGSNPESVKDIVDQKIKAGNEQMKKLYGYKYLLNNKEVTTNDLDDILRASNNLTDRLNAWNCSKEVGKDLKLGLSELQMLRNKSVQALDYKDFFEYQATDYGMDGAQMMQVCQQMIQDVWPLYRELHTWARYELASKYQQPVPEMLPAHWLPNRWGQDWTGLVDVKGLNIDAVLKEKGAEWIVKQGEQFYVSLGFDSLPKSFYEKSSLYPLPEGSSFKKNNHASAWHMDNDQDVRSLMSIEPNTEWWETTLHELGHIYYYLTYSNKDVPVILRSGANRAYHEAMGTLIGLASLQKPFLQQLSLVPVDAQANDTLMMLKEALNYVVLIPWSAGVMTDFEYQLYAQNLPAEKYNQKWWDLVKKYQGIVPPTVRGEEYCDAATKTHINDDPSQYYDYALSNILLFQFHDHISREILKQDPHQTNYWGKKQVGDFLRKLMYPGASQDWRELLKANIGSDISARPMLNYFSPLMTYLQKKNQGRTYTLPEKFN